MIINIVFFWMFSSVYLLVIEAEVKELYGVQADEVMNKLLKGVYKGYLNKIQNVDNVDINITNITYSTTIKAIPLTTIKSIPKGFVQNMTVEEFNIRRRRSIMQKLLEYKINTSPDFQSVDDEITIQTRRFKNIVSMSHPEDTRREFYFKHEYADRIYRDKNRTMSVMQQFIYETHYMLPHMQVLRKKYNNNMKYQMGYCFALLRNLKKQQMMLFSTLKIYFELIVTVYSHLQFYEKIVRLDIDIKDVLRYMFTLDAKRKNHTSTS